MKADSMTLQKVFQNGGDIHYVLPHFQREYAWEKPEWEMLLEDACTIYEEVLENPDVTETVPVEHFLGSLVVVPSGVIAGTITRFMLVDGQQRLTTISLLFCALSRLVAPTDEALSRRIKKLIFNLDETGDAFYKLLPTTKYSDRQAYKAILKGEEPEAPESRIPAAYAFFYSALKTKIEHGAIIPERLFRTLANVFQVVFISLEPQESPYKIFESLNAKGKPLTQADLVRNFIAITLPADSQENVFCNHWSPIENVLQEKRTVGKSGIGELTAFLRHYLAMQTGTLCNENHVYARFRDRINLHFKTPKLFAEEIERLHHFANLYNRLLRPEKQPSPELREAVTRLDILDISTAYPFLMAMLHGLEAGDYTQSEILNALDLLENYLVRRFLAEEPTNYLNKTFPQLWQQIDRTSLVSDLTLALQTRKYPSDTRIRQKLLTRPLYGKTSALRRQLIFLLEEVNHSLYSGTDVRVVLNDSATIEHILPQTLTPAWEKELGDDKARYAEIVHTLGNLTLVTGSYNSTLSNESFSRKKQLLADHGLRLNSDYFTEEVTRWNEAAITARSNDLIDRILTLYPDKINLDEPDGEAETPASVNFQSDMIQQLATFIEQPILRFRGVQYKSKDHSTNILCLS